MTRPSVSDATIGHLVADGLSKPLPLYTHATIYNGMVFVSCIQGFIPGTLEFPADPLDEARQVLANLETVLVQAGSSLPRVLKISIFMTDMTHFSRINEAVNEAFPVDPPARSSIAVAEMPKGAKVVIEAIAATGP